MIKILILIVLLYFIFRSIKKPIRLIFKILIFIIVFIIISKLGRTQTKYYYDKNNKIVSKNNDSGWESNNNSDDLYDNFWNNRKGKPVDTLSVKVNTDMYSPDVFANDYRKINIEASISDDKHYENVKYIDSLYQLNKDKLIKYYKTNHKKYKHGNNL